MARTNRLSNQMKSKKSIKKIEVYTMRTISKFELRILPSLVLLYEILISMTVAARCEVLISNLCIECIHDSILYFQGEDCRHQ